MALNTWNLIFLKWKLHMKTYKTHKKLVFFGFFAFEWTWFFFQKSSKSSLQFGRRLSSADVKVQQSKSILICVVNWNYREEIIFQKLSWCMRFILIIFSMNEWSERSWKITFKCSSPCAICVMMIYWSEMMWRICWERCICFHFKRHFISSFAHFHEKNTQRQEKSYFPVLKNIC